MLHDLKFAWKYHNFWIDKGFVKIRSSHSLAANFKFDLRNQNKLVRKNEIRGFNFMRLEFRKESKIRTRNIKRKPGVSKKF